MEDCLGLAIRTEGAAGSVAPTIDRVGGRLPVLRDLTDLFPFGAPDEFLIRGESGGNGCTYDLAERYRLMQSICRTRKSTELLSESGAKVQLIFGNGWENFPNFFPIFSQLFVKCFS
jgi:hypothetical protein